jgi:hypothetical protein
MAGLVVLTVQVVGLVAEDELLRAALENFGNFGEIRDDVRGPVVDYGTVEPLLILIALWRLPNWIEKWLDLRDRLR